MTPSTDQGPEGMRAPLVDSTPPSSERPSEEPKSEEKRSISVWSIWLPLSYELVIGYVASLAGGPMARTLELMTSEAVMYQSLFGALTSVAACSSPFFGWTIDYMGTARPHKVISCVLMTIGAFMICFGVRMDPSIALPMYFGGLSLVCVPMFALMGTVFANLTASYAARVPSHAAVISAFPSFLLLVGMSISGILQGFVTPIGAGSYHFYDVLAGFIVLGDILLLCVDTSHQSVKPTEAMYQPTADEEATAAPKKCDNVLRAYLCDPAYLPFRLLVVARMIFQGGTGMFGYNGLYFIEDVFSQDGDTAQLITGRIGVATTIAVCLVFFPASILADKMGKATMMVAATLILAALLIALPFAPNVMLVEIIGPLYGVDGQLYGVVDFALIVLALPNPATQARDVGTATGAASLGGLLFSALNGAVLSSVGGAPRNETVSGSDHLRPTYSRHDFALVLWPAGLLVAASAIPIIVAARVMRNNERRIRRATSAGTVSSVSTMSRRGSAPSM
jgi:MFS family permease